MEKNKKKRKQYCSDKCNLIHSKICCLCCKFYNSKKIQCAYPLRKLKENDDVDSHFCFLLCLLRSVSLEDAIEAWMRSYPEMRCEPFFNILSPKQKQILIAKAI